MNYGKRSVSKKQKRIASSKNMKKKKLGIRLFKGFLLCLVLIAIAGVAGGFLFFKNIIKNAPEVSPSDVRPSGYSTFVYADDETTEIEKFVASGSNRVYKSIADIPIDLQHAFVAIEDERFYDHNGIDPQGILRAAVTGVTSGNFSQGASTITQQLIKNNIFPNFVSEDTFYKKLERKIQEQYLALNIEKQMTKDEILESYLNTINLGQSTLGVQAASKRYFNKDVSELTLSESAVIAGITQNPTAYNPVTYPETNSTRRDEVLNKMLDQGYIDQAAYDEAMADDVYARIQNVNAEIGNDSPYSYFVDALSEQVIEDLQTYLGYTETQAYNALYSGGLSIYSTQNLAMQQICDEEMNNDANYPWLQEVGLSYALTVTRADGTIENYGGHNIKNYAEEVHGSNYGLLYSSSEAALAMVEAWKATIAQEGDTYDEALYLTPQPQASVTIMDQSTGEIKAIVGGRGAKETSQSLNRAYKGSPKQPGSTFKILSAYAPALDTNEMTLATTIVDEPWHYSNGTSLKNASGSYMGAISVRTAIQYSQNMCAVKAIQEITPSVGYEYLKEFGFSTLDDSSDINESIALGGLTHGVYNYELCAAFAAIANDGIYNKPTLYTKILDHDGNVLLENNPESRTVIKDTTAALLTSAMQTVVTSGTGTRAQLSNMPVAGKTGTTDHDVDQWFCGYTPYYTCAVWGGYDENKSLTNIDTTYRFRLWKGIMERIHANLEYKDFEMPSSLTKKTVCSATGGLVSTEFCTPVTEYFAPGTTTDSACTGHQDAIAAKEEEERQQEEAANAADSSTTDGTSSNTGTDSGSSDTTTTTPDTTAPDTGSDSTTTQ